MPNLTGFQEDRVGAYIEKDPYAILDYSLDWTNWMPSGDTITSITVSADAGITIDSTTNTDYIATANISGGTAGNIYNIEFKIVTTNGLRDSRNFRIKVLERQA
jgi:hypothetical protein